MDKKETDAKPKKEKKSKKKDKAEKEENEADKQPKGKDKDDKKQEKKPPEPRKKILLVTGSNRGLGLGIIEGLLEKKTNLRIILTSRDEEAGQKVHAELLEKFPEENEKLFYHQLDITKEESIAELVKWIKATFKKIDYIVNNAGVSSKGLALDLDVFNFTFETNVFSTITFTEKMLQEQTMNKAGKIILIGSSGGYLSKLTNETLISSFKNAKTTDDLYKLADKFKASIENGTIEEDGWCKNTFAVSKMIINTYARILAKKREVTKDQISVYACNPGWVKTDMGGDLAPLTIQEGVLTPIYLIELPDGINKENQGKFFSECKIASFD